MRKSLSMEGKVTYQISFILVSLSDNGKRYVSDSFYIPTIISIFCLKTLEVRIIPCNIRNIKTNIWAIDVKVESLIARIQLLTSSFVKTIDANNNATRLKWIAFDSWLQSLQTLRISCREKLFQWNDVHKQASLYTCDN